MALFIWNVGNVLLSQSYQLVQKSFATNGMPKNPCFVLHF